MVERSTLLLTNPKVAEKHIACPASEDPRYSKSLSLPMAMLVAKRHVFHNIQSD